MTSTPWDAQGEAQAALRTAALSNAQTMTNLLKDMLPDTPRESSVLVATAEAGVAGLLPSNLAQGIDLPTASRPAAGSFENRTALTPRACARAAGVSIVNSGAAGDLWFAVEPVGAGADRGALAQQRLQPEVVPGPGLADDPIL